MKAILILLNWCISLCGLSVDTDTAPMWVVLLMMAWFASATLLLKYADKKGWMDKIVKR